jgi:hypothetical protein
MVRVWCFVCFVFALCVLCVVCVVCVVCVRVCVVCVVCWVLRTRLSESIIDRVDRSVVIVTEIKYSLWHKRY